MMVGAELPPTSLFSAVRTLHHQAGGFQAHPAHVLELSDAEEQEPCSGQAAALLYAPFQQKQPLPTTRLSAGDLGSHIRCLQHSVKAFKGTTKTPLKCPCLTKHPFRFKPSVYHSSPACLHRIIWVCTLSAQQKNRTTFSKNARH